MDVRVRLAAWLDGRSPRERTLLAVAGTLAAASLVVAGAAIVRDDLSAAQAAVAEHERELAQVRRLAATLERARAEAPGEVAEGAPSLPTLLEAAAGDVVGRERIASMTPAAAPDGETRIALRIAGASLEETVRVVHALESAAGPVLVARLGIEKHADDARRFDVLVEVRAPAATPPAGEADPPADQADQ
jgi:type II secretory pathway component PulM